MTVPLLSTVAEARSWRRSLVGRTLGFVPTMGALHEGHLSLVRRSAGECDETLVSVFVNPLQFGPNEDFDVYPRPLDRDRALAEEAGATALFAPPAEEMYPEGFVTSVEVAELTDRLCGRSRPGHFRGVTTVVCKLLHVAAPHRAYFGQKDAQQAAVLRRMVRDLAMDVEMAVCPIVRDPDGLALSSRNAYLSEEERRVAPCLHEALRAAEEAVRAGERDAETLRGLLRRTVEQRLGSLGRVEYAEVVHPEALTDVERLEGPALAALAVHVGSTRLIDNLLLSPAPAR